MCYSNLDFIGFTVLGSRRKKPPKMFYSGCFKDIFGFISFSEPFSFLNFFFITGTKFGDWLDWHDGLL